MTPNEFKAWFDGFTEAFSGCPTKAQWTRIKERVSEIDGKAITERVYVDRYWPAYPGIYHQPRPYYGTSVQGLSGQSVVCNNTLGSATVPLSGGDPGMHSHGGTVAAYNSLQAMNALGKAEAKAFEN